MTREALTFKNDVATKQFHVPSRWEMYTQDGNAAVKSIATDLVACAISKDKATSRLPCFKDFTKKHHRLSNMNGTKEITDTAVREVIVDFLADIAVETNVDPRAAIGIFYRSDHPVDIWNCSNNDVKEKYWWSCNPKPER